MYLPDINIWLALTFQSHFHHEPARNWFEGLDCDSCVFCRLTQLGFLRLATNPSVFGDEAVTLAQAWQFFDIISDDERVLFAHEPGQLEDVWRNYTVSDHYSNKVWNDAYLTAFAETGNYTLITFDKGFLKYKQLQYEILSI